MRIVLFLAVVAMSDIVLASAEPKSETLPALAREAVQASDAVPITSAQVSDGGGAVTLTKAELCSKAFAIAASNNLPWVFFTNLISQESGFQTHVVSRAGAQGIAQFMPATAASNRLTDPFEPVSALAASGKLLAELVSAFGNIGLAAAAYNAGPQRVQDWMASRRTLPSETRQYVYSITGRSADQWARHDPTAPAVELPLNNRCSEVTAAPSADADGLHLVGSRASTRPGPGSTGGIVRADTGRVASRRSIPRPSHFAIGMPVSRAVRDAEQRYFRRAARAANRSQPVMNRFVAMATPVIMKEERSARN